MQKQQSIEVNRYGGLDYEHMRAVNDFKEVVKEVVRLPESKGNKIVVQSHEFELDPLGKRNKVTIRKVDLEVTIKTTKSEHVKQSAHFGLYGNDLNALIEVMSKHGYELWQINAKYRGHTKSIAYCVEFSRETDIIDL